MKVFLLRGIRGWKACTVCFGIDLSLLRNRISPSPDSLFVGFYLWCSCLGWLSQWWMDDSDEEEGASFVFVPVLQHDWPIARSYFVKLLIDLLSITRYRTALHQSLVIVYVISVVSF